MQDNLVDDPVGQIKKLTSKSGKLELRDDGAIEYVPSKQELQALNDEWGQELDQAILDHEALYEEWRRNWEAYYGKNEILGDGDEPILTLPIVGRDIDQLVAFMVTTIMRPRPIVSVDPYLPAEYDVLSQSSPGGELEAMGLAPGTPMQVKKTSEDVGAGLELGLDWKLREKLGFRKWLKNLVKEMYICGRAVSKVVYERRYREGEEPILEKAPEGWVRVAGRKKTRMPDGEACRIENISNFNFLTRIDDDGVHGALCAERIPMTPTNLRRKFSAGEYSLIPKDEWDSILKQTTDNWLSESEVAIREHLDHRATDNRRPLHDIVELYFSHPVEVETVTPEGSVKKITEIMEFQAHYHCTAKRFLYIVQNPYPRRPYTVVFEDEEPGRFSSTCVASRIKKHQALLSQMLHLRIKSQVAAVTNIIECDPDSGAWEHVKGGLRANQGVPVREGERFEMHPLGQAHSGLTPEIGFVSEDAAMTSGISQYERGANIPGRTPAASISQIMQAGYQRNLMILGAISDGASETIRLLLEVGRKFQPFGEVIPYTSPDMKETLDIAMRYPVEDVLDNFRISLTAADEELAKEAEFEQMVMMRDTLSQFNNTIAQIAGPLASTEMSPAVSDLFATLAKSEIEMMKNIISSKRRDSKKFLPSPDQIDAILAEKEQAAMMMQMQQQQQQQQGMMGGPGEGMAAQPGGGIPPGQPPIQ